MKNTIILLFAMPLAFVACGEKHGKQNIQVTPPPAQAAAYSADGCDVLKTNINSQTAEQVESEQRVEIERDYQRVLRRDCSGKELSDDIETVAPPQADVTLQAPSKRKFQSVFVFNQDTCDHRLTAMPLANGIISGLFYDITGDGHSQIMIKGDLSDAVFTFRLQKGENRIFVQYFYDCSPNDVPGDTNVIVGTGNCDHSKDSEIVEYPVFVDYTEKTLAGQQEDDPTAQECQEQQQGH